MSNLEIIFVENEYELQSCLKIRDAVFTIEKGVSKDIEVDEWDCLNKKCNHFLIQYNQNDIGTIRCMHTSEDTIRIQRFCFLKDYRQLGLGKLTMDYIENYYSEQGKTKIEMDAKYDVSTFYEKCGYQKISDVFMEVGIKHVKMIKEL